MGVYLDPLDLPDGIGSALGLTADQMIDDAEAQAMLAAPCLGDADTPLSQIQNAAVVSLLRGAILRWNDAGSGARQSVTTGPFSETTDTTVRRSGMFWPSEITSLQGICSDGQKVKAFGVDTISTWGLSGHSPVCSLMFGGAYCTCGFDIAGSPIYEPEWVD